MMALFPGRVERMAVIGTVLDIAKAIWRKNVTARRALPEKNVHKKSDDNQHHAARAQHRASRSFRHDGRDRERNDRANQQR